MVRISQADNITRADEVIILFIYLFLAVVGLHCRAAFIYLQQLEPTL